MQCVLVKNYWRLSIKVNHVLQFYCSNKDFESTSHFFLLKINFGCFHYKPKFLYSSQAVMLDFLLKTNILLFLLQAKIPRFSRAVTLRGLYLPCTYKILNGHIKVRRTYCTTGWVRSTTILWRRAFTMGRHCIGKESFENALYHLEYFWILVC